MPDYCITGLFSYNTSSGNTDPSLPLPACRQTSPRLNGITSPGQNDNSTEVVFIKTDITALKPKSVICFAKTKINTHGSVAGRGTTKANLIQDQ